MENRDHTGEYTKIGETKTVEVKMVPIPCRFRDGNKCNRVGTCFYNRGGKCLCVREDE